MRGDEFVILSCLRLCCSPLIIDRLRSYKKSPPKRELVAINEVIGEMVPKLRIEANEYAVDSYGPCRRSSTITAGPGGSATGTDEPDTQRYRGDEGYGRRAHDEVAIG
jgi:hypothetical protein